MTTTFDGDTLEPSQDQGRLTAQLAAVKDALLDGGYHTLPELEARLGYPQASISARLRDLRKPKFGGYGVDRRRIPDGDGLHEYRLLPPDQAAPSRRETELALLRAEVATLREQNTQLARRLQMAVGRVLSLTGRERYW